MLTTRFDSFEGRTEDDILEQYGYPDVMPIFDVQPFYNVDNGRVFLFVDGEDIVWMRKPNVFSMILYQSISYKTPLVDAINGKTIEVFVKEKKYFQYFGCYKMVDPYVEISGAGRVLQPETPLEFIYDME